MRSDLCGIKRFGCVGYRLSRCDHVFLVAAVVADATHYYASAIGEIASSACQTGAISAAKPSHSDSIAFLPLRHTGGNFINHAGDLVSGNARKRHARKPSFFGQDIAVTNPTGFDANPHLSRPGLGNFALHDLKVCSRFRYLNGFHFCHFRIPLSAWVPRIGIAFRPQKRHHSTPISPVHYTP